MALGSSGADDSGDDDEWRFSLSDIEARNDGEEGPEDGDRDGDDSSGNVAGAITPTETVEAGEIDVENALFVIVGVALAVLVVAGFVSIFP
jgi:hypothetical protein